ncbi:MAG TPA: DUF1236 domain-containing protein [Pseudolabrys sp.]|nr:DUF1236 domain-containing protein [Pseudolabrys sp.]
MRKTLLMTTAAAALILGGSFATAQDMKNGPSSNSGGATRAPAAQQNAPAEKMAPNMNAGHHSQTTGQGSSESKASEPKAGHKSHTNGQASESKEMKAKPGEKSGSRAEQRSHSKTTGQGTSESRESQEGKSRANAHEKGNMNAREHEKGNTRENARGRNEREGAQNNTNIHERNRSSATTNSRTTTGQGAAGTHANLSSEQRTKITTVIKDRHVRPVEHVNFNISVGTRVPHSVHLYPLPTEVVSIYPAWRGYEFILVEDEIVVINPHTFEIVAVLPA